MDARAIIARKRDCQRLDKAEIRWFAQGLADGAVTDAQAGAFAMAVLLNGMDEAERVALTLAMRDSGDVQVWDLPGPVLDKHSTGGVGDNVSLMLAPALAACGAYVPMISGRGLGHTGGTLDKLDAIVGYKTEVPIDEMRRIIREVGCAIVGATGDIAPADKRLYAVRDVSATVESLDLITASILSKKLAAGLEGLVLDVKTGSGAFISDAAKAADLARALVSVANGAGCKTTALITDMNEPLASSAGNALEVANAVAFLRGDSIDSRLWDVTIALGGALLETGGLCERAAEGQAMIAAAFQSGAAAEKFASMVAALGGPVDFIERAAQYLPKAPVVGEVVAQESGFIQAIDTSALGLAVVGLGGGRQKQGDTLDYSVGLDQIAGLGLSIAAGEPIAVVHAADTDQLEAAKAAVQAAYLIGPDAPDDNILILEKVG
ncbi:MAG: thymidine phosphorylase [Alphaproteobacteria bacterium]|nr:thymidine phosphorylase [Alphaproteobacteria bacterium]